ncbi:MAG: metallophosphoesterase [Bacilli bacterium]|nr:metallophosphoesterase [Bacilli bacterium]
MKTLVIPDLHLKQSFILPIFDNLIKESKVDKIVFLGDYFDEWLLTNNTDLYYQEIDYMYKWIIDKRANNVDVRLLLGNHDIPYLTKYYRHYSHNNDKLSDYIKDKLFSLGIQICIEIDNYLLSHGGYANNSIPEDWHFKLLDERDINKLIILENNVGISRGGTNLVGNVIWCDYDKDLLVYSNEYYPKQIVGHTPQRKVTNNNDYWCVDTFSLNSNLIPYGNGEIIIIDDGKINVLKTNYLNIINKVLNENEFI